MASSSSSSSSCCKRRREDSPVSGSCEKRVRQEQDLLTVKDLSDLIQHATLTHIMKPSWWKVSDDLKVSRVNVTVLDGLSQIHFYRYFTHFKHLRSKYSHRWTLAPSSGDLLSELLNTEVTESERSPALMMWHPVIGRFGLKTEGLSNFLLTEQEMIKHNFPVKGGRGCEGFVCTQTEGGVTDGSPLFGLDCEMCLTATGVELTRVAVVDSRGHCVLDELVKPLNPIINYCTRFSGITKSLLAPVTTRLADVQLKILQLLPRDAVLVGHSLENDLRALKLIHPHVIDTSLLYRREFSQRFKLKQLAAVILKREIQTEDRRGHDPCEDALAALHLAQYFISKGARQVVEDHLQDLWGVCPVNGSGHVTSCSAQSSPLRFGHALYRSGQSALFLGRSADTSSSLSNQHCRRQHCSNDKEVLSVFRRVLQSYSLSVLQFNSYSDALNQTPAHTEEQQLQQMTQRLREMCVLYVGPLCSETSERDIHKLFKHCGHLETVRILHNTHRVHAEVVFQHLEGAQLAVETLHEHLMNGSNIKVQRPVNEFCLDLTDRLSERMNDPLTDHMIYVCNLSSKRDHHDDLLHTFKQFGPIQHIMTPTKHAGKRRHAFIRFEDSESVRASVGVSLQIRGRKLSVCPTLTPPHLTSWMQMHSVTTETSRQISDQREDESDMERQMMEQVMEKLDGRVRKVFRALDRNTLSVVILPGRRRGGVEYHGLCFIHIKSDHMPAL